MRLSEHLRAHSLVHVYTRELAWARRSRNQSWWVPTTVGHHRNAFVTRSAQIDRNFFPGELA